jgi:sigma-B regulation protein RsbU (phosphoserine phosphatase)
VAALTDYIDIETLQQLQDRFVAVAQVPIRICAADSTPLTRESSLRRGRKLAGGAVVEVADVQIRNELIARLVMTVLPARHEGADDGRSAAWRHDMLQLMAGVLGGLWDRQQQLRTRADQLATLYTLTAEFTGEGELQAVLDRVAQTVVKVLKGKGCSIRLLSADRTELVMKSVANLSPAYLAKGPVPLSASQIDRQIVETGKCVYIADERTDGRVLYSAQARREGIVSALCVPMMHKGRIEGVLRVYMGRKHVFDWFEESLLTAIAAEAAAAIVSARLREECVQAAEVRRALQLAADVQRQMIPAGAPVAPGLEVATKYVPCYELGGDFFDFLPLPEGNLGVAISDIAGKGVRAALLMASIRASLRAHAASVYAMSDVVSRVNRDLCRDVRPGDFATMFYGVLDTRRRRLTYVNAGHLPPMLFRGGEVCPLSTRGALLGVDARETWTHDSVTLQSGDVLLLYTDGLSEAMNHEDVAFGAQRIAQAAQAAIEQRMSADGIVKHIVWEQRRFTGIQSHVDDLTMVAIRVL